ncbi:hypothetical protein HanHA300_Chr16g0599041 [Helianthus annuus]|nr:hypothetical protein HanHA300_Chr16g0599041 [Helianthus annuus]KAJ0459483.1 hypothetical protein HanHA89_Chr16g0649471 [Helianthus annuus]
MDFRGQGLIPKEELKVAKDVAWYEGLQALPNLAFGENVLLTAGMSDKWPQDCQVVPVLLLDGVEIDLYHKAFPACSGVMDVRSLGDGEEYWYEQMCANFLYPPANAFAAPPTATKGAHVLNPRPCRAVTPSGEEIVLLSSKESISSSKYGLNVPPYTFVGSLRDMGVDADGQKLQRPSKREGATAAGGAHPKRLEASDVASDAALRKGMACPEQRSLDDFIIVVDSMEELYSLGGKFKAGGIASAQSSGSVSFKEQPSSTTPTSAPSKEEVEADTVPELTRKNASKRHRKESSQNPAPTTKKVVFRKPIIGKKI